MSWGLFASFVITFITKVLQTWLQERRATQAAEDKGRADQVAADNAADAAANRRAAEVAINAPDVSDMLEDLNRGRF
jgi:membrane protein involved in colicin uptake